MQVKIAILDMYAGAANQGMRCIRELINQWGEQKQLDVSFEEFEVRNALQVPDTSFDMYISTGGPGSPLDSEGTEWENNYFQWLASIENWNNSHHNYPKKKIFFICHSFQLACRYFKVGEVCQRKSTAFGVFPVHLQDAGETEPIFDGLNDPFYVVDSRDFQVIQANEANLEERGMQILAIEKDRPHVPYERAIMAMRFSEHFVGTQFHPEADAIGMSIHLQTAERRKVVVENHGEEKWQSMIDHLNDPDKILWTYSHIIPNFFNLSVDSLATTS